MRSALPFHPHLRVHLPFPKALAIAAGLWGLTGVTGYTLAAETDASAEATFRLQCSACHALDQSTVGPSLVEIAGIYREDADGFVKWCLQPGRKRPERIEMPSMAHVGEPALRGIREYILEATRGKKEKPQAAVDLFAVPPAQVPRPSVQRIFLADASPAAIAVALPGDLSYCFDAAECRLRYVWKGGFLRASGHWLGNGSALAAIDGQVIYREEQRLVRPLATSETTKAPPPARFLGYSVKQGLPSFRYEVGGVRITETVKPLADGTGIERHFETTPAAGLTPTPASPPAFAIDPPQGATLSPANAERRIEGEAARSFTLTLRWNAAQ